MTPVFALVGRPNVGKSTLFNRLTRSRDALVASFPGLTRDRQYGKGEMGDFDFIVVDTGGLSGDVAGVLSEMAGQVEAAIQEADIILFMLDAKAGRTGGDEVIAEMLRLTNKPVILVANKIDGQDPSFVPGEFYPLGFNAPQTISATNGHGVLQLLETMQVQITNLSDGETAEQEEDQQDEGFEITGIKIAVVGRPNVGKSTLVNRLLGEERVVVFDEAGTTRDSIYIPYERGDRKYTLIDTAGVRRRGKVNEKVEKFSVIKTLEAISNANVVIVLIDAREGIVDQDLHLVSHVLDAGRALVIAVNKWDGTSMDEKQRIRKELDRKLIFLKFSAIHFISALHGSGVGKLYDSIHKAYESATRKLKTPQLNDILEKAVAQHAPPLVKGRRIKLRYAHAGGSNPPIIVIHGNQTGSVPEAYQRYLQNKFVESLQLEGTPVRLEFKTGENPFKGRRNKLTLRQVSKKRRLMKHVKKAAKKKNR